MYQLSKLFLFLTMVFVYGNVASQISLDTITISTERVKSNAPYVHTNVDVVKIKNKQPIVDIPVLLQQEVGVLSSSDAGNGIGYSNLRIRGVDASRINITINGVPINDAESHQLYWVNMPDIISSSTSLQIQRGVGTISNGNAGFGASINIETIPTYSKRQVVFQTSIGSYNSKRYMLNATTPLLDNRFVLELRGSLIASDGYIERAKSNLKSYYAALHYINKKNKLSLLQYGGKEKTYQAWYGVPQDSLFSNRNFNAAGMFTDTINGVQYYQNQTDNYLQRHTNVVFKRVVSKNSTLGATLFHTYGTGYYDQYNEDKNVSDFYTNTSLGVQDVITQKWLTNNFYGGNANFDLYFDNTKISTGVTFSQYKNKHNGDLIQPTLTLMPYYFNKTVITQQAIYTKIEYTLQQITMLAEAQLRSVAYSFKGTKSATVSFDITKKYVFFNPRVGLFCKLNTALTLFASYAIVSKEPNRDDQINRANAVAETLYDFETGVRFKKQKGSFEVVLYNMKYTNQLVLNGRINDVGEYVRTNVKSSYRRGVELIGSGKILRNLTWSGNATFAQNKILNYVEFLDNYDIEGQTLFKFPITDLAFAPDYTFKNQLELKYKKCTVTWQQVYVSKQYLDNTSNETKILPSMLNHNLIIEFNLKKHLTLTASVYNIFSNNQLPNGYTYSYISNNEIQQYNFFYPNAPRNFMFGMQVKL